MATHVLKVGGTQLEQGQQLSGYLAHRTSRGDRAVVVHGGGRELSRYRQQVGIEVHSMLELEATSPREMEMVTMVLCGLVNKRLVAHLLAAGDRAVGLSGVDFSCMHSALVNEAKLGRVGGPPRVDPAPIRWLLDAGYVVIVAPVCVGEDGGLVKANGDAVAQSIAVALEASTLEFAGDSDVVRGSSGPIARLSMSEVEPLVASPGVRGSMVHKLHASMVALEGGVARVRIGSLDSLERDEATVVSR